MKHNGNLQAVLDKGEALLACGDVAGYWKHMSKFTDYAWLARDVARGDGLMARHVPYTPIRLMIRSVRSLGMEAGSWFAPV